MTWSVRRAGGDEVDLASIAAIVDIVTPEEPTSPEQMRWSDATYPGTARFLVEEADRAVGAATVGRIYMYPPEFDALWATICVLPAVRRRGIGSALYAAVSDHAAAAGKRTLHVPVSEARPEAITFLEHRGFREYERQKASRLDLAGLAPPPVDPPSGIEITSLARRPDLVAGVHAVALEAFPDIPGGDSPMAAGSLDEFRARDIDRPSVPHDGIAVAVEAGTDVVVGYASLYLAPGARLVAWHDMTAVARAWRGRGVAVALKRATIGWAISAGLEAVETGNDIDNAAMRSINIRMGYRPLPDSLTYRGPLAAGGAKISS